MVSSEVSFEPSSAEFNNKYDAIVIGAGIAGMMAATHLSAKGHTVLVLEHNHQPGGLMAGIWRRGFYFDVGCQSFENMGIIFPLLEQYGLLQHFEFHRVRYRLKMPKIDTVVQTLTQTCEDFKQAFPELKIGFDKVFNMHQMTSQFIENVFVPDIIPYVKKENNTAFAMWLAKSLPWVTQLKTLMLDDFGDWYRKTLPPSGVRDLLASCGYSNMNVFVASAFWHLWANDYWYPRYGYQNWFDEWAKILETRGVRFKFKSTVTELEKKDARINSVTTKKGERYFADQIIYAGDYKQAVYNLLGSEYFSINELNKLENAKHSDALVSVYLGLNFPVEKLRTILKSAHVFYFPNEKCQTALNLNDEDAHKKVFLEITAHCLQDQTLAPPEKSAVVLQAFTKSQWLDDWKSIDQNGQRSLKYKELKQKVADDLINIFAELFPQVREYIEYCDVGSPMATMRFTKNHLGGSCGFELNWKNYPFKNFLAHTASPFENFHFAGHFTVWPGAVPTAALSGKIAAVRAAKQMSKNFHFEKIKSPVQNLVKNNFINPVEIQ